MKQVSKTTRIGVVRRLSKTLKSTDEQSSSVDPEQPKYESLKEQPSRALINEKKSLTKDEVPSRKHVSRVTSPNNVRLQDMNQRNNIKQQPSNDMNSYLSSISPNPQQPIMPNPDEIPTKTGELTIKKLLLGISTAVIVVSLITVATVLAVVLTRPIQTTSITTSATTPTTTGLTQNITTAYWSFDNSTTDLYGVYDGLPINAPTFTPAGSSSTPYVGYGRAIILNPASLQSVLVPTFFDLTDTSFTIETWIFPTTVVGDHGIFGQCSCSTCSNQCLYFIVRSSRLYIGFTSNDLFGSTILSINNWYHVAFVYNYQTQQQILYVNGVQDSIKSNAQPYQGINGSIQIGSSQVYSNTNYFQGYIDNLLLTTRAKSADEILRDASLMAYYSFDLPNPNADNSPNRLNGTSINTVTTTGRVNQAIRLTGMGSYFQAYAFYQIITAATSNKPFSVSMWIYPTTINTSTLIQLISVSLSSCANLLGISASSSTSAQLFVLSSNSGPSLMTGPFVTQNIWTHISLTFGPINGYTLYVNGIVYGIIGITTYPTSNLFSYLYIGYSTISCGSGSANSPFQGSIDEVYIHNRELTQADVTALANP